MHPHVFVDESKARRGYLLVAATILPCHVTDLRKNVGALKLPGQRRIHFTAESDTRRKTILSVLGAMGALAGRVVTVYDASTLRDVKEARDAAMIRLVDDAAKLGAELLVIEQDDQALASDRRIVRERAESLFPRRSGRGGLSPTAQSLAGRPSGRLPGSRLREG